MGMDPVTIGLIATAVISAAGATYSGIKQHEASEYNAAVAEQEGIAARDKAAYDEKMHRERVRKLISGQRAAYGQSGVEMSGSPLLTMEDTAGQSELDALAIRHGGSVDLQRARSQARGLRAEGDTARTSGYIQAGSTLLSGGSKAYSSYKSGGKTT